MPNTQKSISEAHFQMESEQTEIASTAVGELANKKMKRLINLYFISVVIGTVSTISSLAALQTLQTSINIEGSTGSIAITSGYIGSIVYAMFVAPAVTEKVGLGISLVLADLCLAVYSISNFYPELYVLVPGSLFSSVTRATLLPLASGACFHLAVIFSKVGSKPKNFYITRYQGRLMGIFNSVSIIGNSISFSILYAGSLKVPAPDNSGFFSGTTATATTSSSDAQNVSQYHHCGVNDCQDPEVVSDNIDQYVPPNKTSVYILISVTTLMCLIGAAIHGLVYPGVGRFERHLVKKVAQNATASDQSPSTGPYDSVIDEENGETEGYANRGYDCDMENEKETMKSVDCEAHNTDSKRNLKNFETPAVTVRDEDSDEARTEDSKESYVTTLKKTGRFFLQYKAILLSLTPMRTGMIIGFLLSDVTRAYTSCVMGVEMTALITMLFGTTGIPVSLIYGRFAVRIGKNVFMGVAFVAELAMYVGSYLWVPNPDTIVVVCFLFVGGGIANGILKPLVSTTYNAYFPEDRHITNIVWNFWTLSGIGLQYGLSTTMCMVDKIYFTAAFSLLSVILYALLEVLQSTQSPKAEMKEISFETRL